MKKAFKTYVQPMIRVRRVDTTPILAGSDEANSRMHYFGEEGASGEYLSKPGLLDPSTPKAAKPSIWD